MTKYGLDFDGTVGEFIKFWRKAKKINSKELSKEIGKSDSYVSHLENGRYKNPDYETLYEIFKRIGIKEDKIEDYLYHFHIISPDRESWEEDMAFQAAQPPTEEDIRHMEEEAEYFEQHFKTFNSDDLLGDILGENIKSISGILHNMADHDIENSYDLIIGLSKTFDELSTNQKLYRFMIKFFSEKVPTLDEESMVNILNTLYKELNRIDQEKTAFGKPKTRSAINKL
ncbi:helix-turn-helix domain-containing protein [Bacillus infantis]|uniref:helix-turn-helix domain-containing protein n=1 Tax=Bacillus infantis TaxID=324767 RepID=UPI003CFA227D